MSKASGNEIDPPKGLEHDRRDHKDERSTATGSAKFEGKKDNVVIDCLQDLDFTASASPDEDNNLPREVNVAVEMAKEEIQLFNGEVPEAAASATVGYQEKTKISIDTQSTEMDANDAIFSDTSSGGKNASPLLNGQNHDVEMNSYSDCSSFEKIDGAGLRPFTARWTRLLLKGALWLIGILLVRPICFLLSLGAPKTIPPIKNPILTMRAEELAQAIRARKLRSEDVVAAYIARIQEVNPAINAVVDTRFSEALEEARLIDARLDKGDIAAQEMLLVGVPITVKESIAVKGMSHMGGKPVYPGEDPVAREDSPTVSNLRAAGAIPLCVTNTPEHCLWWESYNSKTGYTVNPYDTRLTAGGSSGGEGALLGSAASVLGLGSDVAGSCRLPAFYCCVCGHKPTPGVVISNKHAPECDDPEWPEFFSQGPMSRYVSDLPLALQILAAEKAPLLRLREKVDIQHVRIFYVESEPPGAPTMQTGPEVREAMHRALDYLRGKGLHVQKLDIGGLEDVAIMSALVMCQLRRIHSIHYDPKNPDRLKDVWMHLFRYLTCRSRSTLHAVMSGIIFQLARKLPKNVIKAARAHRTKLQAFIQDTLGEDGVLLYPSAPTPAHRKHLMWHRLLNTSYMMIFNTLGLPVTQVPLGLCRTGLPVGLQVAAAKYQDRLTLAVGQELERAFGGWVPPPSKESPVANGR